MLRVPGSIALCALAACGSGSGALPGADAAGARADAAAPADATPGADAAARWESIFDPSDPLPEGISVLWVGAHPDDETTAGAAIYRSCQSLGNACRFAVMTDGGGGTCYLVQGCGDDLGAVRTQEMLDAAACYGGDVDWLGFTNYPAKAHETPDEVLNAWTSEGDPVRAVARAIREFRPDVVVTFHPSNGFTGHVEHRAVGMLAEPALALASDPDRDVAGLPAHTPQGLLRVLNRYPLLQVVMGNDSAEPNATFDIEQSCTADETCLQAGKRCLGHHASQEVLYDFLRGVWQSAYKDILFEMSWL